MAPLSHTPFFQQLYTHLVLPPDVLGCEDVNLHRIEDALLNRLHHATTQLTAYALPEHCADIVCLQQTLLTAKALNVDGVISKAALVRELQELSRARWLIVHGTAQNCALLIHFDIESDLDRIVFEVFEASAPCETVLACKAALLWSFPGSAVAVPHSTISEESLQSSLATFLQQASTEVVLKYCPTAVKAGQSLPEIRDTSAPDVISSLFMTILEGNGEALAVPILQKRVRDTVCFDNARKPWRRSPFYLVLRVTMQRLLYRRLGPLLGRMYYKLIMCLMLSQFLEDALRQISPEAVSCLRKKLGRRLAKLEGDMHQSPSSVKEAYAHILTVTSSHFKERLRTTGGYLKNMWRNYKLGTRRHVPILRQQPYAEERNLQLLNSSRFLEKLLVPGTRQLKLQTTSPSELLEQYERSGNAKKAYVTAVKHHSARRAHVTQNFSSSIDNIDILDQITECTQLSEKIHDLVDLIAASNDAFPSEKSQMFLHLFELWVKMDAATVQELPLLLQYHPVIHCGLLEPLHFSSLRDLKRMQNVHIYLERRTRWLPGRRRLTVFDNPSDDCFAARYYDDSENASGLQDMREEIEERARIAYEAKGVEWEEKSAEYAELIKERDQHECKYDLITSYDGVMEHKHRQPCKWHDLHRKAKNCTITIFEHPLPSYEPEVKAVIFELRCPKAYSAYRDTTWRILSTLCHSSTSSTGSVALIREYSQLRAYVEEQRCTVTLASAKKAHLDCHYAEWRFPLGLSELRRSCGLKPVYYDTTDKAWTADRIPPSLWHHFPIKLPRDSPYHGLQLSLSSWPTSNQIQSNQSACPFEVNAHEFTAWQGLMVGTHSRWLDLLRELASTNLNFSTESTLTIVRTIAYQAGPSTCSEQLRRDVHAIFADKEFCMKLLEQIEPRLQSLRHNWRDFSQMDLLITLLLRIVLLAPHPDIRDLAISSLKTARTTTDSWRSELHVIATKDPRVFTFVIWASILCRRTVHWDHNQLLQPEVLRQFIDASITLHYHFSAKLESSPHHLREAVVHDHLFAHEYLDFIKHAIISNKSTFKLLVDGLWQAPDTTDYKVVHVPKTDWIHVTLKTQSVSCDNHVHYNMLLGTFLVNGQEMRALPPIYRQNPTYHRILQDRNPIVFPSPLSGMEFQVADTVPWGHRVHLGFRNDELIIRVVQHNQVLELVPSNIFHGAYSDDLPSSLTGPTCYHWLNVYTGEMEIRAQDIWSSRYSNWNLVGIGSNIRQMVRQRGNPKQTMLLEPTSELVHDIARIFKDFEDPAQILVFAASNGFVTAELKSYELSFFINANGLLQSSRLGAFVSQFQDCGTWYGLRSKMVMQSVANRRQKSILVPFGDLRVSRDSFHVSLAISSGAGLYLRFTVNEVLGRIDCAPEPNLLYMRALLHAYTSSFVLDSLTGRTGLEEAQYLLQTASHLPWQPLTDISLKYLALISSLSPVRGYYPPDLRRMETIKWRAELPISIQDDRYRPLVARIIKRSTNLAKFSMTTVGTPVTTVESDEHLAARALARCQPSALKLDSIYDARDMRDQSHDRLNVLSLTRALKQWQLPITMENNLTSLLQDAPVIGGYDTSFQKSLLTDLLALDVRQAWGSLTQACLNSEYADRYKLMFSIVPIAYSDEAKMDFVSVLLSFAMIPEIKAIPPPKYPVYLHYRADGAPPTSYLISFMKNATVPFDPTGYKKRSAQMIAEANHEKFVESGCKVLAESIQHIWPDPYIDPGRLAYIDSDYVDLNRAIADVTPEWVRFTHNHELTLYLERVQQFLNGSGGHDVSQPPKRKIITNSSTVYPMRTRDSDDLSLSRLLSRKVNNDGRCSVLTLRGPQTKNVVHLGSGSIVEHPHTCDTTVLPLRPITLQHELNELRNIVSKLGDSDSFVQSRYAEELDHSIVAFQHHLMHKKKTARYIRTQITAEQIDRARNIAGEILGHIRENLQTHDPQSKWLQMVELWPMITTVELLSELRTTSGNEFGEGAKEALINLGLSLTQWQRLLRLRDAQKRGRQQQEISEWENTGHTKWNPIDFPDWLLLEVDGDILLREEQIEVALATIAPASGNNAVLQLLMGRGKTSCILPMVASVLASGMNLNRIVVPRSLLLQSAQVMQAKLGGLVNRELIHIPFSRKTSTTRSLMRLYGRLHKLLMARRGIMLTLPEHVLSFKLGGQQRMCDDYLEEAAIMIQTQEWLDEHTRDVLDESDVSLATKTQLIYPSGSQTTVDGHPLRWQITQTLLHLVKDFTPAVQSRYPQSVELVKRGDDSFPLIYFLRQDAEDYLVHMLVDVICKGQIPSILPCADYPFTILHDIKAYVSAPSVTGSGIHRIKDFLANRPHQQRAMDLLRGLFVHRLLIATLRKRWNVQYGLDPARAPIAVPFLAKGVANPSSEWGHPDVAILLTCLSFYYQGLNTSQFRQAFEYLGKIDEPAVEYEKWFPKGAKVPRELEDHAVINVDDATQLMQLYQLVRTTGSCIDFYLNNFVFPKYAKTFGLKLQASGWNLFPSVSTQPADKRVALTGFSGTNDSRHQLPMLVAQSDLPQLSHTNAEVPVYLLQSRNSTYVRMVHPGSGSRWTERDFLCHLSGGFGHFQTGIQQQGKIRVLIDAGAQILEHSNIGLARAWLEQDHDASAAVYFEDDDRAWVIYRNGRKIPLLASPFVDNLDRCVVYLDESHCRGTDLRFPPDTRAALTLGRHLTKDALVQAAMRLRLLGDSQSVTFFSPPEVHQGILDCLHRSRVVPKILHDGTAYITSAEVLQWVFTLTCEAIEQMETLYFAQTSHYLQQEQARLDHPDFLHNKQSMLAYRNAVRIKETVTLKQLYEPKSQRRAVRATPESWAPVLQDYARKLQERKSQFQDRGISVRASALEEVEVEQEREMEVEVEAEVEDVRETQRQLHFSAFEPRGLHEDILHFSRTGNLVTGSDMYRPMFSVLAHSALGLKHAISPSMKSNLWVSKEYERTVDVYGPHDNFIRPTQWVLWSPEGDKALLLSPEEANKIIPILRRQHTESDACKTHLVVYAAPVTRRMLQFNRLDYYCIPALPSSSYAPVWLRIELGIFSGRLFLEWDEYNPFLDCLGLNPDLPAGEELRAIAKKPLVFLHAWSAMRRKGQDFEHTPVGFICASKPLTKNHPFFRILASGADEEKVTVARITSEQVWVADEDAYDDVDEAEFAPATEHVDYSDDEQAVGTDEEDQEDAIKENPE